MPDGLEGELTKRRKLYRDIFEKSKIALVAKLKTFRSREEKLHFLLDEVSKDILTRISNYKECIKNYKCAQCGTCCKAACGEFSYDELLKRAENGDEFAKSFTSVFVPYKNKEEAQKEFGEYAKLLKKNGLFEDSHFYYCPKLIEKDGHSICGDYENRPMVCRDFPNNPLVMLPEKCSFNEWKEEFEVEALFLKAMIDLVGYFIDELKE